MGNHQSSANKNPNLKEDLEEIYNQVLSPKHIEETIQQRYCNDLLVVLKDDVLKKYSKDILGDEAKKISLGYNINREAAEQKNALCDRLAVYYMKKINLIGTIINSVRLAHLKLDRIKNGGLCFGDNLLGGTAKKVTEIPIQPSIPYNIGIDVQPIFLEEDFMKHRREVLKKANIDNSQLIEVLSLIELDNERDCLKSGGKWLDTREDAQNLYLIPTEEVRKNNKKWFENLEKLETSVYENVGKLVNMLDLLVEERIEPRMINGKEERIKIFRDRLIFDGDLDSLILKTKRQILDLFLDLDSYFLILFSIKAVSKEDLDEKNQLEERLKELKNRGV